MHRHQFPCPLVHLSSFLPFWFQKWSWVSYKEVTSQVFIPLMRFLLQSLFSRSFSSLLFYSFESLSQQTLAEFSWSLCDNKSLQVSTTLLSILADLYTAEIWMITTCPQISKSARPSTNHLGIVPSPPNTIGITVTFMFHIFFSSCKVQAFTSLFTFFKFYIVLPGHQNPLFGRFFCCWQSIDLVVWSRLGDTFVSQNPQELRVSHSPGRIPGCAYSTWLYGQI